MDSPAHNQYSDPTGEGEATPASTDLLFAARLSIELYLEQWAHESPQSNDDQGDSVAGRRSAFEFLDDGFSDERKDRIYSKLWNYTLSGCIALAPLHERPESITELGFGSPLFVSEIAERNPNARVFTVDHLGSRSSRSAQAILEVTPNTPLVVSRNMEHNRWGRDRRLRGRQALVIARLVADGNGECVGSHRHGSGAVHTAGDSTGAGCCPACDQWNWPHLARQSLLALKPGGWMEVQIVADGVGSPVLARSSADAVALRGIQQLLSGFQQRDDNNDDDADDDNQQAPVCDAEGLEEESLDREQEDEDGESPPHGFLPLQAEDEGDDPGYPTDVIDRNRGRGVAASIARTLRAAGFHEVTAVRQKWWCTASAAGESDENDSEGRNHGGTENLHLPGDDLDVGQKERELARLFRREMRAEQLFEAMVQEIKAYGVLSPKRAGQLLSAVQWELSNPSIRAYYPTYVVYGRKPFN